MQKDQALIIIPTYNERENIVIIPEIKSASQVHILVVDDSSPDGTAQSVREMASTISDVYLLERPQKMD